MKEMFGKISSMEKYKEDAKSSVFSAGQKSPNRIEDTHALKKEWRENSLAKANMLSFLMDSIVGRLCLPENYKIINKVVGEGEAEELADKLWKYSGRLGTKKIEFNNSAIDIMRNLETSLLGSVNRVKRKGLDESYEKMILEDFNAFKDYANLLTSNRDFEKGELGSEAGFLKKGEKKDYNFLRSDKKKYVEKCKEEFGLK
jgi:hypothetical protein